jgi:hypothetical protein
MTAHHALHHGATGFFPALSGAAMGFVEFGQRVAALAPWAFKRLTKALHQDSFEDVYLAQAQNIADLERRMFELQSPDRHFSTRHW